MANENKPFESINAPCDAKSTYNFVSNCTTRVGHLIGLKFPSCGKDLIADMPVPDPESPESKINTVGVFNYIGWDGSPTSPVQMIFRLSPKNKATMQEALSSLTGGTEIEAKWVIYEYDYVGKKYFKHFHTDEKDIKFVITKNTRVEVEPRPDLEIQQPVNFLVNMSLTGKSEGDDQELSLAFTSMAKFQRRIGVNDVG